MGRRDPRHERGALARVLAAVLVVALGAATFGAFRLDLVDPWYDHLVGDDAVAQSPAEVAPPPGLELPALAAPAPVAAPLTPAGGGPGLDPAKVAAALAPALADPDLGPRVLAAVADLSTGETVLQQGPATAIPASTTKVLTAVAALAALGPERRFTTRVVAGGGNRLVLVGGGDPLLSSAPERAAYPARADVVTLARRTARALAAEGRTRVRLGYDDSLFSGPAVNPAWPADYVPDGVVSPITALWVDEGRTPSGGRVADPSLTAAGAFRDALVGAGIEVVGPPERGVAAPGGREVAAVEGAPLREVVDRVLLVSDNEASEVLAHHVGLAHSGTGSPVAGAAGTLATLQGLGVDTAGVEVYDGSGLSRLNLLTTTVLIDTLAAALDPARPDLATVASALPVAGFTGSLSSRFEDAPPTGRGTVRAKTGTLTAVSSLAGIATDASGNPLLFVLMADRVRKPREDAARDALDAAAAALGACACG